MVQKRIALFFHMPLVGEVFSPTSGSFGYGGAEVQMSLLIKAFAQDPSYQVIVISDKPFSYPDVEVRIPTPPIKRGIPLLSRYRNQQRIVDLFATDLPHKVLLGTLFPNPDIYERAHSCGVKTAFRVNGDSLVDGSLLNKNPRVDALHAYLPQFDLVLSQTEYQHIALEQKWSISSFPVRSTIKDHKVCRSPEERSYLLWVGRAAALKRPWYFIELAKQLPATQFVFITTSTYGPDLRNTIKEEARHLSNFTFHEDIPYASMHTYYENAQAFISTSLTEGAPSVFAEAAIAGTPIISLSVDPGGVIDRTAIGTSCKGSFPALFDAVRTRPPLSHEQHESIRSAALKEWDPEQAVDGYRHAFDSLW